MSLTGFVSFIRYLYTLRPDVYPLDVKLHDYEYLFLAPLARMVASLFNHLPLLLNELTDYENSFLVARTAMIDRVMVDALLYTATSSTSSESNRDSNNESSGHCDPHTVDSYSRNGFRQILILGAGFDSRAYRFHELRKNKNGAIEVLVIEVDQSIVQQKKVSKLKKGLGEEKFRQLTEGVEFVECNFDYPNALFNALSNSKFDPSLQTFVLLEGVTYYLSKAAISETLTTLSRLRSTGRRPLAEWKLVFDFVDETVFLPTASHNQKLSLRTLAAINAPFKSGLPFEKNLLNECFNRYEIQVDKLWKMLSMMAELFPNVYTISNLLPMALAECHWTSR